MMTLTEKETSLLKDLSSQEKLCIEKYGRYAEQACDPQLKTLFIRIRDAEQQHIATLNQISNGETPSTGAGGSGEQTRFESSGCDQDAQKNDAFLCSDALAMEKHVSTVYDTCIFEFGQKALRNALNHIQKEEQEHGEEIYKYMSANGMYS